MNCPMCGTSGAFMLFVTVECKNPRCKNFVEPKGFVQVETKLENPIHYEWSNTKQQFMKLIGPGEFIVVGQNIVLQRGDTLTIRVTITI